MPEKERTEQDDENDFASGFAETTGKEATPKRVEKSPDPVDPPAEEEEDKAKSEETPLENKEEPPRDEVVTLTKAQFDAIMAGIEEGKSMKKAIDSLSGTLGATKQKLEALESIKSELELNDDDFKELTEQFPEIGAATKATLTKIMKKAGVSAPSSASKDDLQKMALEVVVKHEQEALEDEYPDWRTIIGTPGSSTDFRKWLSGKTEAYRTKVESTWSSTILARAIRNFQKDQKKASESGDAAKKQAEEEARKKAEADARSARLKAAVQPRGDGGQTPRRPATKTEDEEFESGYKEERTR